MTAESRPNCIGYAYWRAGLQANDKYAEPPFLKDLDPRLVIVDPEKAIIIATASPLEPILLTEPELLLRHMAYIDPDNPNLVWEREGIGLEPCEQPITIEELLKRVIVTEHFYPIYLGIKKL